MNDLRGYDSAAHALDARWEEAPAAPTPLPLKQELLGVGISLVDRYEAVVAAIIDAARARRPLTVSALNVHALMLAVTEPAMAAAIRSADIVTTDGQPVRWALNALHGARLTRRIAGPDLMLRTCEAAAAAGLGIFLYGSLPPVLAALTAQLAGHWRGPALHIAGAHAPRMRPRRFPPPVDEPEDREDVARIRASGASIVLVGLGCPLQEMWAAAQRERLSMPILCVGAAFDFHAGMKPRAPLWMQDHGLEWLHRLAHEPRRLAGRYLRSNAQFLLHMARALGDRRWRPPPAPAPVPPPGNDQPS